VVAELQLAFLDGVRLFLARHRKRPDSGAADEVLGLLDRVLAAAQMSGCLGSVVDVCMLQTLVHDSHGRGDRARHLLAQALTHGDGAMVRLNGPRITVDLVEAAAPAS
jgi:zinc transporter ZupT